MIPPRLQQRRCTSWAHVHALHPWCPHTGDQTKSVCCLVWNTALKLKQHTHTHNHHLSSPPNANRAATPAALLIEGDSNQRRRSQARLWLRRAAGLNQRKWWRGEQIRVWTGTWQPAAGAEVAQREHRRHCGLTLLSITQRQHNCIHFICSPFSSLTHSILPFTASVPFN